MQNLCVRAITIAVDIAIVISDIDSANSLNNKLARSYWTLIRTRMLQELMLPHCTHFLRQSITFRGNTVRHF